MLLLKFLLLLLLSFKSCCPELSDPFLKIMLSEILKVNTTTCDDLKSVFSTNTDLGKVNDVNITADVFHYITVLVQDYNNKSEQNNFLPKQMIKAVSLIERIFEKLVNIKTEKLNKVISALEQQNQPGYEYFLLKAVDILYNHNSKGRNDIENLLTMKYLQGLPYGETKNSTVNGQTYYGWLYFTQMTQHELRSHGRAWVCFFFVLANITNDYAVAELLQNLDLALQDFNTSVPMLIFLNEFLEEVLEGTARYRSLYTDYLMNQLESAIPSVTPQLVGLQNVTDMDFNQNGTLALVHDWGTRMQEKLVECNFSKYFQIMDETFQQAVENHIAPIFSYRTLPEESKKSQLIKTIKSKTTRPLTRNTQLMRFLTDIENTVKNENVSSLILEFIDECLDQIKAHRRLDIMSPILNYVARKLNTMEPFNVTQLFVFRDKRLEQLAPILDYYFKTEPGNIRTMALDWLFDLKIHLLTRLKTNNNLFYILQQTFDAALNRRDIRVKGRVRGRKLGGSSSGQFEKVILSDEDERMLNSILGK